jgi:hypothetical protein
MDESDQRHLQGTRHFFLSLANGDVDTASGDLAETAVFHVPGTSALAGSFVGRGEIVRHFLQVFELTSGVEALQWVDWMVGVNWVSVLVKTHMAAGLSNFEGQNLFLIRSDRSQLISEIRLFVEDQARFDRFVAEWRTPGS